MSKIKIDDIAGIWENDEFGNARTICWDCCSNDQLEFEEKDIIYTNEIDHEDAIYFCDQCGKQIN